MEIYFKNNFFSVKLQCREIGYEIHEEVLKVLHELHTAMKTHHNYQSEFRQAESKLQVRYKYIFFCEINFTKIFVKIIISCINLFFMYFLIFIFRTPYGR